MIDLSTLFGLVNERIRILDSGTTEELLEVAKEIGFEDTPNTFLQSQIDKLKEQLTNKGIDWTTL